MFDRLLLLSEGRTIYLGPATAAKEHFARNGHPAPAYFNPADFFLDILSPDSRSKELEISSGTRILLLAEAWKLQAQQLTATANSDANNAEALQEYGSIRTSDQDMDFNRFVRTLKLLMFRSLSGQLRTPVPLIARMVVNIAFGGIIGGMYSDMTNDQRGIQQL